MTIKDLLNDKLLEKEISYEEIANILPDELLEAAYRKKELLYRTQDAMNHAKTLGYEIDKDEARTLALEFLDNYNCNIPENDQFQDIIETYAISTGKRKSTEKLDVTDYETDRY